MHKLIIVDDEEEVRKGIIQKIDWSKFNFEIAGEAENGREALDLIEENVPDVVITDITMPLMDGLELASILKENYSTVKTVILTGFDEFKFAQQAIKYGVADYLLKPVLPKDIDDLLEKLRIRIENEIARKEDVVMLRKHYTESLPVIRDNFLASLITGRLDENEVKNRITAYGLKLEGDFFITAVANIDHNSFNKNVFEDNDMELVRYAVLNISQEIIAKHSYGEVFYHDEFLVFIASLKIDNKTPTLDRSFTVLEEIRQNVEKYLKISITIGLGSICNSFSRLRDSYRTALAALEYKLVIGGNKVIFIKDVEPEITDNLAFNEGKEKILVSSIKFGTRNDVKNAVDALFNDISGLKASVKDYQLYLMEITAAISKLARNFQLDTGEIFKRNSTLYEEVFKLNSLQEVRDWVEEVCSRLMKVISGKRLKATQKLLDEAKDYMKKNYRDNDLCIQKVADHLHISSSYLSMIFKKDAGVTLLKYLVNIRLEAAKELLGNTDFKTSEIAEKIGYPEINYFSYFFKKNFGISPREYRNIILQKKGIGV